MIEEYITSKEYRELFTKLTRSQVAQDIKVGEKVLDIATGSAYFAIEVAKNHSDSLITGVDIFEGSVRSAKDNIKKEGLEDRINVLQTDASKLEFVDEAFDTVINYLGIEDIHMTRGLKGVVHTFNEVYRVLKPGGSFFLVAMSSDEAETIPQKIELDVFSYVCGAKWLSSSEYLRLAEGSGFVFIKKKSYYTGKKLTAEQAMEEIEYACENVPINYKVKAKSFEETWKKYGAKITKYGMGHYSKTMLYEYKKTIR